MTFPYKEEKFRISEVCFILAVKFSPLSEIQRAHSLKINTPFSSELGVFVDSIPVKCQ